MEYKNITELTHEQKEKQIFVNLYLARTLKKAYEKVLKCEYLVAQDGKEEIAVTLAGLEYTPHINVTGDSLINILSTVVEVLIG